MNKYKFKTKWLLIIVIIAFSLFSLLILKLADHSEKSEIVNLTTMNDTAKAFNKSAELSFKDSLNILIRQADSILTPCVVDDAKNGKWKYQIEILQNRTTLYIDNGRKNIVLLKRFECHNSSFGRNIDMASTKGGISKSARFSYRFEPICSGSICNPLMRYEFNMNNEDEIIKDSFDLSNKMKFVIKYGITINTRIKP